MILFYFLAFIIEKFISIFLDLFYFVLMKVSKAYLAKFIKTRLLFPGTQRMISLGNLRFGVNIDLHSL